MVGIKLPEKLTAAFKKYRYVLLVVALGIFFMVLPEKKEASEPLSESVTQEDSVEQKLESIISCIDGAGKTRVLLTVSAGEQTLYQTDDTTTNADNTASFRGDTVIVTDSERSQAGLVRQILSPKYQGAVIVCQGGGNPSVKLAIVEAVSNATGLGADKITVLKMKG